MYVYIPLYGFLTVDLHTYIHTYIHTHMHIINHTPIHFHSFFLMYVRIHHVHMYTYTHTHTDTAATTHLYNLRASFKCMCVYTINRCVHIHTYKKTAATYTPTDVYMHTYIHTKKHSNYTSFL